MVPIMEGLNTSNVYRGVVFRFLITQVIHPQEMRQRRVPERVWNVCKSICMYVYGIVPESILFAGAIFTLCM